MTKNYGTPPVSGYSEPEGRSWETVVFEANTYVTDRELNLGQDVAASMVRKLRGRSGWISSAHVNSSSPVEGIFTASAVANTLEMPALRALVNGWVIDCNHTGANGFNKLLLGAGPATGHRTDLVILEVWRKLVAPSPSTDGKSATSRIWQNGNVATDSASDVALNFSDDLLDTNLLVETTKRVQVQHRLRVIQGVDLETYPRGIDDLAVFANSVPATAGAPNGTISTFHYQNQEAFGDLGLWRAGDGLPTNALGTVDGYMYAIPLCGVIRRNTTAFDRRLNHNGGVASPGPSDRPDGLFYDIVSPLDLVSLRGIVGPLDLAEQLQKNLNYVMDNNHHVEIGNTSPFGGGVLGTTYLVANEIGVAVGHGGDGVLTGSTGAGPLIGEFDCVRRRFSDRPIMETVTVQVSPAGANWVNNETVSINPTSLLIPPYSAFNWAAFAPNGTQISDVVSIQFTGSASPKKTKDASQNVQTISGLGSSVMAPISITFQNLVTDGFTNEPVLVTLLVSYPNGAGLQYTPTADFGSSSFQFTTGNPPAAAPVSYSSLITPTFQAPQREVALEYLTSNISYTFASPVSGIAVQLRERADSIVSLLLGVTPFVQGVDYNLSADGRTIQFALPPSAGTFTITYRARRPLAQVGPQVPGNQSQLCIYYRAAAPQMVPDQHLPTSLQVIPRLVAREMLSMVTGSGSQDAAYPFPSAYVQLGGLKGPTSGSFTGEHEFTGSSHIAIQGLDINTGMMTLPTMVPMVANPESLVLMRTSGSDVDLEGRAFYAQVAAGYVPSAYSVTLAHADRHRNALPMIAELASNTAFGHKGELVLVVFHRYATMDDLNYVAFDNTLPNNATTASVYRLKGLV